MYFYLFLKLLKLFWLVRIRLDIQLPGVLSFSVKSLEIDRYLVYDFWCLLVGLHLQPMFLQIICFGELLFSQFFFFFFVKYWFIFDPVSLVC